MKKLILVATVALVAVAVVPITSASALTGSCKIVGSAEFKKGAGPLEPLPFEKPAQRGYQFKAEPGKDFAAAEKSGCREAPAVEVELNKASVAGEGQLACVAANGNPSVELLGKVEGTGKIKLGAGTEKEFKFEFVAAGGNVAVVAKGTGVNATGDAEFLTPGTPAEKEAVAAKCIKSEVTKLGFEAVLAGTIE
jgi:hypothetical protein